ncbi:hypothetical protein FQN50_008397 [Emmonsiellopsis sp. PD_5]|nr:hypothetical protein FQN50_008397 [Emmonsiellopsis sp. PD_5]
MASLSTLPTELLRDIGGYVPKSELRNLVSTSKRLRDVFLPLLYADLSTSGPPWTKVALLIRTILYNRPLARQVCSLDLTEFYAPLSYNNNNTNQPAPMILAGSKLARIVESFDCLLLNAAVGTMCKSDDEKSTLLKHVRAGKGDALAALLLSMLPDLKSVRFRLAGESKDYEVEENYIEALFRRAVEDCEGQSRQVFAHLQSVYIEGQHNERLTTKRLMFLFKLPSLRRISGRNWTGMGAPPAPESAVTYIDLRYSNGLFGMEELIRACPQLNTFAYSHGAPNRSSPPALTLPRVEFWNSLQMVKDTLQVLCLDFYSLPRYFHNAPSFGSLAHFTALKHLHMSPSDFSSSLPSILPRSLRSLRLATDRANWDYPSLKSDIAMLVDKGQTTTPYLASITVEGICDKMEILENIEKLCSSAGIAFLFIDFLFVDGYQFCQCHQIIDGVVSFG